MTGVDWPLLVALEASVLVLVPGLTWVLGRRCAAQIERHGVRRADALFRMGRVASELPALALLPALGMWLAGQPDLPRAASAWLFAIGWTAYSAAWVGMTLAASGVHRKFGAPGLNRWAAFTGSLFVWGWTMLTPLFAGWLVVALMAADWFPHEGPDLTGALSFAVGNLVATAVVGAVLNRATSPTSAPPQSVLDALAGSAGPGELPTVVVAPLGRAGLPGGIATRRRGRSYITIDSDVVASFPPEETNAILLHELGHHRLGHLRSRTWRWKVGMLVVLAVPTIVGWGHVAVFAGGMWLVRRLLLARWRRQELEADAFAAERCGARSVGLALARTHRLGAVPEEFEGARAQMTHPDLVQRLAALAITPAEVAHVAP